jgi:GT2 family glycosyltransferase
MEVDRGQYDEPRPCVACGGAMLVRRDVFEQLDGFDASFNPFGPEDIDFSLRLQKAGYAALYVPQALAYHEVSHSYGAGYTENYARGKVQHWVRFLRRHGSPLQKLAFFCIGAPFIVLRMIVREGRRGNLGAVRGAFRGAIDLLRSSSRSP